MAISIEHHSVAHSAATSCATFKVRTFRIEKTGKDELWPENTGEILCGEKSEAMPRNGQIVIFKSCASAISPHRLY
jgi:hypothetical protein